MKTDDLIDLLATGVEPVAPRSTSRRLLAGVGIGVLLAVGVMLAGYGVRADLLVSLHLPMMWVKLLVPLLVGCGGYVLLHRLARPGARVARAWLWLALPLALLWALGLAVWLRAPVAERMPLLLGRTWTECAFNIALIAAPVFVAAWVALRGLAPTRPALAGAAAGAMAGGAGGCVYALHCTEMAAPFLAVWYAAGMLIPVVLGALLGPRLLRW